MKSFVSQMVPNDDLSKDIKCGEIVSIRSKRYLGMSEISHKSLSLRQVGRQLRTRHYQQLRLIKGDMGIGHYLFLVHLELGGNNFLQDEKR